MARDGEFYLARWMFEEAICNNMRLSIIILFVLFGSCTHKSSKPSELGSKQDGIADTTSVFTWTTELCENKGTYNSKIYTAEQLQNTYDLWFTYSGMALETDGTAYDPKDISKLDTNKLSEEYHNKKNHLEQMDIVNSAHWHELRKQRIQELEDEFELKRIAIQAYTNTSVLLTNRFSKYCPDYVKALTSKDTSELMNFWKEFAVKQSLENGDPQRFMEKFYAKFNSKDRLEYAKVDLITFGWWNCGNNTFEHINRDMQMEEEFNSLFSDIKSECDEP